VVKVEAEATGNTLSGTAVRRACTGCSGGQKVGSIGNGAANSVTVNNVTVPAAGAYDLSIWGLVSGTRTVNVSVNGGPTTAVSFTGTSWAAPISRTATVTLKAGANTIRFFNATANAPDLDRIEVRSTTGPTQPPGPTPDQYLLAGGALGAAATGPGTVTLAAAGGANHDGTPANQQTFTASGLNLTYKGGTTTFDLFVDSASAGNGTQVRVSYDLTGDGSYDRIETYRYFATDPVPGYEHYTNATGLLSSSGALGNLTNGRVRVEVWNAIGGGASSLGTGNQSMVKLPYS
jgi:hypothetical protein